MVSSPRISICPAGFRINRDYASEAGLQDLVQEQGMKLCGQIAVVKGLREQSNGSKKKGVPRTGDAVRGTRPDCRKYHNVS